MYELIQAGKNTFYVECPSKIGIFRTSESEVVLIDSGSDKDAAKKVCRILDTEGWTVKAIFNTHSHADHIGGNNFIQTRTGCRIYANGMERAFTEYPLLEPTILYGGFPPEDLRSKFFMAKESEVSLLKEENMPDGLQFFRLPGHSFDMVGFRTSDDVLFLADSLASEHTLEKYRICYLFDVESYLSTLEEIKKLKAVCYIPSHAAATEDIIPLAQINIDRTNEVADDILNALEKPMNNPELLTVLFEKYNLEMSLSQIALLGSTLQSYLSFLKNRGKIEYYFESSRLFWRICR